MTKEGLPLDQVRRFARQWALPRSAELAWETERGAVLLAPEAHQPFAEAGWCTFPAEATDLTEAILAWWAEGHP